MDEPKPARQNSVSRNDPDAWIGGVAPIAVDDSVVASDPGQPASLARRPPENSHVVYCDGEQEVREGFAIALRAMGLA